MLSSVIYIYTRVSCAHATCFVDLPAGGHVARYSCQFLSLSGPPPHLPIFYFFFFSSTFKVALTDLFRYTYLFIYYYFCLLYIIILIVDNEFKIVLRNISSCLIEYVTFFCSRLSVGWF